MIYKSAVVGIIFGSTLARLGISSLARGAVAGRLVRFGAGRVISRDLKKRIISDSGKVRRLIKNPKGFVRREHTKLKKMSPINKSIKLGIPGVALLQKKPLDAVGWIAAPNIMIGKELFEIAKPIKQKYFK